VRVWWLVRESFALGMGQIVMVVLVVVVKGKAFPVQSMKAYRGNKDVGPLILNLCTRWKSSGLLQLPAALLPGKNPGVH
jgi:hypothetical protein